MSIAQVPELLEACANTMPLQVDLTDLISVDASGIEALQRLRSHGATLIGAPGYLQLKLDSYSGVTAGSTPPKSGRRGDR